MTTREYKEDTQKHGDAFIAFAFSLLFLIILLRTAWISDDAAITLRTVLNFLNGFGPTFNIDERVQAFTHPLWFFALSINSWILGNVFYATFFTSIAVSALAFFLLIYRASHHLFLAIFIAMAALLSKSFIDFSTSGLENPLSHLLLLFAALTAATHIQKGRDNLTLFFLICSGLYLNRPDSLLMMLPLTCYLIIPAAQRPGKLTKQIAVGALPVIIWTTFSLFYYGFPLPNTAYAKLGTGIALDERIYQGLGYLLHSVSRDPVTIFLIVSGIIVGLRGEKTSKLLSIGILLYIMYTIYIGGDFMEGRFLTAPLLMSLFVFSREISNSYLVVAFLAPTLILGANSIYPNVLAGSTYSNSQISDNGIADERGFYFQKHGLLSGRNVAFTAPEWTVTEREVRVICGGLGYSSIGAGPGIHFIDKCALTDPLLSRLPAKDNPNWRIGHFERQLPTNYQVSIERGENLLPDQRTKHYWNSIRTITRGQLFELERLIEIIRVNFGLVEKPDWEMYIYKDVPKSTFIPEVSELELRSEKPEGTPWNAAGNIVFEDSLDIALEGAVDIESIDISVDNNDAYEILGLSNAGSVPLRTLKPAEGQGLVRHRVSLDRTASNIEKIRVTGKSGDGMYSIGHLLVNTK